jgi:hypothetical protein
MATSNVKYLPNIIAEYQRSAIPSSIKQTPTKKSRVRFHIMAACGRSNESEKSIAIPINQRTVMRLREPWSRTFDTAGERLTLQATSSGTIQDAQAPQKTRATIGPAENGEGSKRIFTFCSLWPSECPALVVRLEVFDCLPKRNNQPNIAQREETQEGH